MTSRIHPVIILSIIAIAAACFAADPVPPYQAKIVGSSVSIFSKPSTTDSYICGTASQSDIVTVVRSKDGWAKIMPVEGCFSWISADYIELDKNMPSIGMVTGNSVRVWAGSEKLSPLHSTRQQTSLNKGEVVTLLGDKNEGYYKIVPPVGAYLWVQGKHIEYAGSLTTETIKPSQFAPIIPPAPSIGPAPAPVESSQETASQPATPAPMPQPTRAVEPVRPVTPTSEPTVVPPQPISQLVAPTPAPGAAMTEMPPAAAAENVTPPATVALASDASIEADRVQECRDIKKLLDAECQKPVDQQYYEPLAEKIQAIIDDPKAGKAKRYAEYEMELVKQYVFAKSVSEQLKDQDKQLENDMQQIKADYIARSATIPVDSQYTVAGVIKPSQIYTENHSQKRFVVVGDDGKILCYALPNSAAVGSMAHALEGKKVGLNGSISKDPVNAITVVRFSQINLIEQP